MNIKLGIGGGGHLNMAQAAARLKDKFQDDADMQEGLPYVARSYPLWTIGKRLWPLFKPQWHRMVITAITIGIVGIAVALIPLFAKVIVDNVIAGQPLVLGAWGYAWEVPFQGIPLGAVVVGTFLLTVAVRMALWYVGQLQANWILDHVLFGLRSMGFHHAQQLCQRFHHQFSPGKLFERIFGASISAIQMVIFMLARQITHNIASLVISLVFCFWMSVPLTLLVLSGAGLYALVSRIIGPRIYAKTAEANKSQGEVTEFVIDRIRGVKAVQAMAMEQRVQKEFDRRVWSLHTQYNETRKEALKLGFFSEGVGHVLHASVLLTGAYLVMGENIEVGTLVAFIGYQGMLVNIMTMLVNAFGNVIAAKAGLDQFFSIMDTPSTLQIKPNATMPQLTEHRLRLENVGFRYEEAKPVLHDLSIDVPHGQSIGLVGRSGSGKTTLCNLLMRFHDVDSGRVTIDGHDVRDLPLRDYRALFSVVLQEPYLFATSIKKNLKFAKPDATDEQIEAALKAAQAWEFVQELPSGVNYKIGESGKGLSGGQRGRIAIARALIMDTPFVVMDEPTAALDGEAEAEVHKAIQNLCKDRTVFIITHRLSTLKHLDRILVMNEGRVDEEGTYQELIGNETLFRKLHDAIDAVA